MPRSKRKVYVNMGLNESDPSVQQFLAKAEARQLSQHAYATELFSELLHQIFPSDEGEQPLNGVFIPAGELLKRLETVAQLLSTGAGPAVPRPSAPPPLTLKPMDEKQGRNNAARFAARDDDDD